MPFGGWKNAAEHTNTQPRVNVDQTPPPCAVPTEPERNLTMEERMNKLEADQNAIIKMLEAKFTIQDELKAILAVQNNKILAQDNKILAQDNIILAQDNKILAQNDKILAQDDTINELKANMAAQYLAQGATIEKLEAEILAQGVIIKTLEAANMDMRRQHTLEIDHLNTRLTERNEELAEKLTAHSAEIKKLQNDNKELQKCIRVLMPHARNVVRRKWLEGFRDIHIKRVGGRLCRLV